ncbi:MAG TPA: hypothetical protein IGR64_02920 [Leptolyngbyaceae cyanobacterium M65_K2018_010]|nr:hypothetical protein [Leptolyngbyaceae cyanobacterium M65_K2018_010]
MHPQHRQDNRNKGDRNHRRRNAIAAGGTMLSFMLTYQDTLYLVTKLGALGLVLLACWLVPKLEHQKGHT